MSPDRRRSGRLPVQIPATITRPGAAAQRVMVQDISGGGMRLATPAILEGGTRIAVEIMLPDRKSPVTVQAEVVWSRPVDAAPGAASAAAEAGIQFLQLDPKDRAVLMLYARLKTIPPQSPTP
ncbi:MAG: PilZ domain-containing protein [Candidatus Omnitrophica bacterium]|nr:PilZ domain-containing protein [Candidatus Omnitrophota bacterium]